MGANSARTLQEGGRNYEGGAGAMEEGSLGGGSYLGPRGPHPPCLKVCFTSVFHKNSAGRSRN